jgi:predicted nucleic acid-binding protein
MITRAFEVLFMDASLVSSALARMEQFDDKRFSLTDCVSFELMDRLGIKRAFAFDLDFRDCGTAMLPPPINSTISVL